MHWIIKIMLGIGSTLFATDDWYHHRHGPLSKNIGNEIIYQIVVDRFANGNRSNDCAIDRKLCGDDWVKYQGGDLRGVINKTEYLHRLGISRVWLTPIFENLHVTVTDPATGREITSYHGYWIKDWFRLDPHFTDRGSQDYEIINEMIQVGWERGKFKYYFDTVVNHTSPLNPSPWSLDALERRQPLGRSYRAALFEDGTFVTSYDEDVRLARQDSRYQKNFNQSERTIGEVNGSSDWNDPYIVENYNLQNLADIDQTSPRMRDYFQKAHDFWKSKFSLLAGYRMDTIKHVNNRYWEEFSRHIFARFADLEIMGEYFGGGATNPLSMDFFKRTAMTMLDFDFRNALVQVFLYNHGFEKITKVWANDERLEDAASLITYLDSHDHPRLRGQGMSYEHAKLAISLWLTSRGVPCIYQGIEQDLFVPNDPGDPFNRPMMTQFDEDHELYKRIQRLNRLRKNNSAIRYGSTHVIHQTQNIIAYERVDGQNRALIVLSKNPIAGRDRFTLEGITLGDDDYRDIINGQRYRIENGRMEVALAFGDSIILTNRF